MRAGRALGEDVGVVGWGFLALVGIALPLAAAHSARALRRQALPPRRLFLRSVILQQLLLLAIAAWVARREAIVIDWGVVRPVQAAVTALLLTAVLVAAAWPLWRGAVQRRERLAYFTMPRTGGERALWVGVSLAAGVGEEVTYRAVLYALLLRLTGGPLWAALLSAVAFGGAHLVQGRRAAAILTGVALVFQGFVWHTGGLAAAIAVHVVYDAVAGFAYGHLGERLGYPAEGVPLSPGVVSE